MQTYKYGALLEPPVGRLVHCMGQFPTGNQAYLDAVAPLGEIPATNPCFRSSFIAIGINKRQPTYAAFKAGLATLTAPAGILAAVPYRAMSPHLDLDLRSTDGAGKATSSVRDINNGVFDDWVRAVGETLAAYGYLVLLRIAGECTSPHERILPDGSLVDPMEVIGAYRRIVGILTETGARKNCALGWGVEVGSGDPDFTAYMPPPADFDFFFVDLFQHWQFSGAPNSANQQAAAIAAAAREANKPLWVCESSCVSVPIGATEAEAATAWSTWFRPMLDWIRSNGACGWVYINHDWLGNSNGWLSGRIDGNPFLVQMLRDEFASPEWMHAPGQILLNGVGEMLATHSAAAVVPPDVQ